MSMPLFKKKKRGTDGKSSLATVGAALEHDDAATASDEVAVEDAAPVIVRRMKKSHGVNTSNKRDESPSVASVPVAAPAPLSFEDGVAEGAAGGDREAFQLKRSKLAMGARQGLTYEDQPHETPSSSSYSSGLLADLRASQQTLKGTSDRALESTSSATVFPNERFVQEAKQRRQRVQESGRDGDGYVPLDGDGRPGSRLQREDDDFGGDEDFEDFTKDGRLPLSKQQKKKAETEERRRMQEAFDDVRLGGDESQDDDELREEMEWEAAQLSKWQGEAQVVREVQSTPTRLPEVGTLPNVGAASERIAAGLTALEATIQSRQSLMEESKRSLEQMETDAFENRRHIEAAESRQAWYNEFQEFVETLADFLDDKAPQLEGIEHSRTSVLRDAFAERQERKARHLESLLQQHGRREAIWSQETDDAEVEAKRGGEGHHATQLAELEFRLERLFADVQAAEFLGPAARDDGGQLQPRSVVARFTQWRTTYPDDYSGAWGGLALASIWDFWIRKELIGATLNGPVKLDLQSCPWQADVHEYLADGTTGGDDEILDHIMANSVTPVWRNLLEGGALDPWDRAQCTAVHSLLQQLAEVVDVSALSFKALVAASARPFVRWFEGLLPAIRAAPSIAADHGIGLDWDTVLGHCRQLQENLALFDQRLRRADPVLSDKLDADRQALFAALLAAAPETDRPRLSSTMSAFLPAEHAPALGYAT